MSSDPLLPKSVPLNLAAALLGRSREKVRALIRAGSLSTVLVGRREQIPMTVIESKIAMPVSPAMYLYAERQLDRQQGRL
jgi:hypothetical protein